MLMMAIIITIVGLLFMRTSSAAHGQAPTIEVQEQEMTPEDRQSLCGLKDVVCPEEADIKLLSVSAYSRADSCHNPKDGKCITAMGKDTKDGRTVACPRSMKLGTRIHIEGIGNRICEDRTALWVEKKFGGTIDIFYEDAIVAKRFGRKILNITILP